jgi:hypothetical protein
MALINCAECGNQVSDKAAACPKCGCPIEKQSQETPQAEEKHEYKPPEFYGPGAKQANKDNPPIVSKPVGCCGTAFFVMLGLFLIYLWITPSTPSNTSQSTATVETPTPEPTPTPTPEPSPSESPTPEPSPSPSPSPTPEKSSEELFAETVFSALSYRLDVANGKIREVTGIGDERAAEYYTLTTSLSLRETAASFSNEYEDVRKYRILYYALNWKNDYITRFGTDSYMDIAREYIGNLITDEEVISIDEYFDKKREMELQAIKDYKNNAQSPSYNDIVRNPDNYKGQVLKVKMKVSQVMGGGDEILSFLYENGYVGKAGGNEWFIQYDLPEGASRILVGDTVTFYGEFNGLRTMTRIMGNKDLIPEIKARYYD